MTIDGVQHNTQQRISGVHKTETPIVLVFHSESIFLINYACV
jgi:hypothetical protein